MAKEIILSFRDRQSGDNPPPPKKGKKMKPINNQEEKPVQKFITDNGGPGSGRKPGDGSEEQKDDPKKKNMAPGFRADSVRADGASARAANSGTAEDHDAARDAHAKAAASWQHEADLRKDARDHSGAERAQNRVDQHKEKMEEHKQKALSLKAEKDGAVKFEMNKEELVEKIIANSSIRCWSNDDRDWLLSQSIEFLEGQVANAPSTAQKQKTSDGDETGDKKEGWKIGDDVRVKMPGNKHHGKPGVVTDVSPSGKFFGVNIDGRNAGYYHHDHIEADPAAKEAEQKQMDKNADGGATATLKQIQKLVAPKDKKPTANGGPGSGRKPGGGSSLEALARTDEAEKASDKAHEATEKAEEADRGDASDEHQEAADAHEAAAEAHEIAADAHKEAGNSAKSDYHSKKALEHEKQTRFHENQA